MDANTQKLLVELARTVLRVLDVDSLNPSLWTRDDQDAAARKWAAAQPTPWATATNAVADKGTPQPYEKLPDKVQRLPGTPSANPQTMQTKEWRGSKVRVWTGDRYEVGTVDSLARDKVTLTVRIDRGEGRRDKIVKAHREKAVLL